MLHRASAFIARFDDRERDADVAAMAEDAELNHGSDRETVAPDEIAPEIDPNQLKTDDDKIVAPDVDQIITMERASFAEHLSSERLRWTAEEGARLGEQFCRAIAVSISELEARLANSLTPLLTEHFRNRMIGEFVAEIHAAIADKENPALTLRGPADLLAVVGDRLDLEDVATKIIDDDRSEITAHIGSTTILTRFNDLLLQVQSGTRTK